MFNNNKIFFFIVLDELITTGIHLNLINISRYIHSEYECVARNKIEPDPSRHFKLNINCMKFCFIFIF